MGDRVIVRGRIVARDLIESPLSGARCVYYSFSIEEWRDAIQGLGGDGHWRRIESDEAIAEFYLQVGENRFIVSPKAATVTRSGGGPKLESVAYNIVNRRAAEMTLNPGDEIEVDAELAAADDLFDDSRDYRASAHRYMLRAPEGGKLKIRAL